MPRLHFEDFAPGAIRAFGAKMLTKDEIITFARDYDAQPMHVDEEAATHGFFGTLVASGWHLCAVFMRMVFDEYLRDSSSMGAPGIEEVRWQKPVKPGDVLSIRLAILDTRTSSRRPDLGLIHTQSELLNQHGEAVMALRYWAMMGRREPGPAPAPIAEADTAGRPDATASAHKDAAEAPADAPRLVSPGARAPLFDDLVLGRVIELGAYTFAPDDIKRFARQYDPQPFHVDEAAAAASHFGGLVASGWHTAAVWMKLMIAYRHRLAREAAAAGERFAAIGPSPGFTDLRWLQPVHADDTITFRSQAVEKRPSASRPEWGLVFSRNTGDNQHGERVYEFTGSAFWQRAP